MTDRENGFSFAPDNKMNTVIQKDTAPCRCLLIIFGATGDLARGKIFPAVYGLFADGKIPPGQEIIGFSHTDRSTETFRRQIRESVRLKYGEDFDESLWKSLAGRMHYVQGDFSKADSYGKLKDCIESLEDKGDSGRNRMFYLATASHFFPDVINNLHEADLIHPIEEGRQEPWSRMVIEKPFGSDLDSAIELNRLAEKYLDESQIFRVDHYLAKETVQNIMIFRFANSIFEPVWNRMHIDHVVINASEESGIGTRGSFYDKTGVVRDVVQNHIMQMLTLVAMEPPSSFAADAFHDEKRKFFTMLRPFNDRELQDRVMLGQYKGYREEDGVDKNSVTPTFAAIKIYIDNWRWQDVPFYVHAGKSLAEKTTEISVYFRSIPTCLLGREDICREIRPNVLTLRIQPNEGIMLSFSCKKPGDNLEVSRVNMDFSYRGAFETTSRPAYERLLIDCMRGDQLLFAEAGTLEEQWKFVMPILEARHGSESLPILPYAPGSSGPDGLKDFFRR